MMKHATFMADVFPMLDPEKQYLYTERIGMLMDSSEPVIADDVHEIALRQILPEDGKWLCPPLVSRSQR